MSRALACLGDKTTYGRIVSASSSWFEGSKAIALSGDKAWCGKCKGTFPIVGTAEGWGETQLFVATGDRVACGCPGHVVFGSTSQYVQSFSSSTPSPSPAVSAPPYASLSSPITPIHTRVFAKSCLRGEGCNDAGKAREPHTNFAEMAFYQAVPADDPATDNDVPQHAQSAKKKKPVEEIPEPKKRSAPYKWWFGNHEETDYQAAKATAAGAANARTAVEGASVLGLVGGRAITSGTWAVRAAAGLGEIAAAGPGAPLAALLVGMYPGKLNDGEQDFIDRMRLEQMREAPSRVRYTWETDGQGNPVPHGWHTPPGKDRVRVRKMAWDNSRQAYTFTTEEEPRITIIWTPDSSGVNVPSNTGNQNPVRIPNPVVVDPLPDNTNIEATTSPAAEEKTFADYILILPVANIPPIYVYLSKPPVEFLEVELYSDFVRRSRQGKYEADHMPSKAAVKAYLKTHYPEMTPEDIEFASQDVAAIVIPKKVHRQISETYGGRNTSAQIELDSKNLRAALDRNLDAIKPALKEHGATESQIESARSKMHKLNSEMGLYK